jgi:SacI restriction endonuclease
MARRKTDGPEIAHAIEKLDELWREVGAQAESTPQLAFIDDAALAAAIHDSINHRYVAYRFCLPTQLLGKLLDPHRDCLALQRGKRESAAGAWDARSFASEVVAPFNRKQENVLGASADPYVGNAMRVPRMDRDDRSKKDKIGWNRLIDVLDAVERGDAAFCEAVLRQALLETHRRQKSLRFTYPLPPRVSLATTLSLASQFLAERSGGDRALALVGALFDVIGVHFSLFAEVTRARINASDEASGQAADLECVSTDGKIVLAVEVKDRALKLADVEGTIAKTRNRAIRDVLFAAPEIDKADIEGIERRVATAFTSGQNVYVADFFRLAEVVLALGGEAARQTYLRQVGEHLDRWNTQPSHRQAWKRLLEAV